jgi:hypothetical protein
MYFSHIGNRFCYRSQCLASMSAREDVCDPQGTSINKRKHIRIMSWCIRYSLLPYLPTAALALKTVFPTPLHSPNVCACEAVCVELGRVCHWRWGSFDAPLYPFWVNLSVSYWIKLSMYRLKVGFLRGISDIGESVLVLTLLNSVVFFLVYKVGVTWRLSSSYWIQTKSLPSAHGKKKEERRDKVKHFYAQALPGIQKLNAFDAGFNCAQHIWSLQSQGIVNMFSLRSWSHIYIYSHICVMHI